jgi:hypothetical protein
VLFTSGSIPQTRQQILPAQGTRHEHDALLPHRLNP